MRSNSTKSGLFLMELIVIILFFSLTSAITIQLFVKSNVISHNSINMSQSHMITQNIAEVFRATNGSFPTTVEQFMMAEMESDSTFTLNFSKDWKALPFPDTEGFTVVAEYSEIDQMHHLYIRITKNSDNTLIHEQTIKKYVGQFSQRKENP